MELLTDLAASSGRIGLLAGTFNPPTRAHLALAHAALQHVDAVLFVLPSQLPHKTWDGATQRQRLEMLAKLATERVGVAVSEGGLYIDMVRELRMQRPKAEPWVICGRDAAERIAMWNYGPGDSFARQMQEFRMLVAGRNGNWRPPEELAHAVHSLDAGCWDEFSSTSVRNAIGRADPIWRTLVPETLHQMVDQIYR